MPQHVRDELEKIFEEIRKLRNNVVHGWGYKDIGQEGIQKAFTNMGESVPMRESEEEFYHDASFVLIRLYAKSNSLKLQLGLLRGKEEVLAERKNRGV